MDDSFSLKRWRRYGRDRLYVNAASGVRVGWIDLTSGALTVEEGFSAERVRAALASHPEAARWLAAVAGSRGGTAPEPRVEERAAGLGELAREPGAAAGAGTGTGTGTGEDLATRRPGAAVRRRAEDERDRLKKEAPLARLVLRLAGVHTAERAWRLGGDGEGAVGARLERLRRNGWQVLHAVPVGRDGAGIDHLLIGPGGIYTINTKNHPAKRVWVGEGALLVDGQPTSYLRNSRYEAGRAAKLLSAALGREVPVRGVLVVLTGSIVPNVTIRQQPVDVLVLDRMDVPCVFRRMAARLAPEEVNAVLAVARRPATWR